MPKQFKDTSDVYFVFSVATRKGTAPGGFGDFMTKLIGAGVKVRSLAAFVSGRRTKVFCVPKDAEMFRAFAKTQRLRATQKTVQIITGDAWPVFGTVNKWAISGEIDPAFTVSNRGEAFVYRPLDSGR